MPLNQMQRLAGVTTMTINGQPFDVVSDAEWLPSIAKREILAGQSRVEGYSEMPQAGKMSATLRDNGAISVRALAALVNAVTEFQLANGKSIIGTGMVRTELDSVTTQEGTFKITFEGPDVFEVPG